MSIIVILKFFFLLLLMMMMMIIYIFFFQFISALLWKPICFILMDMLSVFYMLYWNISEIKSSLFPPQPQFLFFFFLKEICLIPPPFLSNWYPVGLTYSLPIIVAVSEICHGTTHCLNTVDHSRWSQETHTQPKGKKKIGPHSRPLRKKLLTPQQA